MTTQQTQPRTPNYPPLETFMVVFEVVNHSAVRLEGDLSYPSSSSSLTEVRGVDGCIKRTRNSIEPPFHFLWADLSFLKQRPDRLLEYYM